MSAAWSVRWFDWRHPRKNRLPFARNLPPCTLRPSPPRLPRGDIGRGDVLLTPFKETCSPWDTACHWQSGYEPAATGGVRRTFLRFLRVLRELILWHLGVLSSATPTSSPGSRKIVAQNSTGCGNNSIVMTISPSEATAGGSQVFCGSRSKRESRRRCQGNHQGRSERVFHLHDRWD